MAGTIKQKRCVAKMNTLDKMLSVKIGVLRDVPLL